MSNMATSANSTGIKGLDTLLRNDGIVLPPSKNGLIILIKGAPGSGKTTLAMQIALAACGWGNKAASKVEIYSHEQYFDDIEHLITERLSEKLGRPSNLQILGKDAGPVTSPRVSAEASSLSWVRDLVVHLNKSKNKRRLLVVDGLNLVLSSEEHLLEAERVVSALRNKSQVGVLVYEPNEPGFGSVDFHADIIIELKGEMIQDDPHSPSYYLQQLRVAKSRFQRNVLGWHQYKIRPSGIQVFPSIHYRIHAAASKDESKFSVEENFDDSRKALGKHIENSTKSSTPKAEEKDKGIECIIADLFGDTSAAEGNNVTVVLGPRRAWKTLLTLDWLRRGAREGKKGLLVSLMDNVNTIVSHRNGLCGGFCPKQGKKIDSCYECYENVFVYYFRPGCIAPCEFFDYLCKRIEEEKEEINRFLFWDLAQLEYRFPLLAADPLFLPGLIDYLKHQRNIPSMFMGPASSQFANMASAIADNVVFCWADKTVSDSDFGKKGTSGWCFYVDRVSGKAEHGKLHFLPSDKMAGQIHQELDSSDFEIARPYIVAIQALQGLPTGIENSPIKKSPNRNSDPSGI